MRTRSTRPRRASTGLPRRHRGNAHIRGLSPFPGAWTEIGGERVKLLASRLAEGQGTPGEVLDDALTVACGEGAVQILRLQRAGRAAQDADAFLRGMPLPPGARI